MSSAGVGSSLPPIKGKIPLPTKDPCVEKFMSSDKGVSVSYEDFLSLANAHSDCLPKTLKQVVNNPKLAPEKKESKKRELVNFLKIAFYQGDTGVRTGLSLTKLDAALSSLGHGIQEGVIVKLEGIDAKELPSEKSFSPLLEVSDKLDKDEPINMADVMKLKQHYKENFGKAFSALVQNTETKGLSRITKFKDSLYVSLLESAIFGEIGDMMSQEDIGIVSDVIKMDKSRKGHLSKLSKLPSKSKPTPFSNPLPTVVKRTSMPVVHQISIDTSESTIDVERSGKIQLPVLGNSLANGVVSDSESVDNESIEGVSPPPSPNNLSPLSSRSCSPPILVEKERAGDDVAPLEDVAGALPKVKKPINYEKLHSTMFSSQVALSDEEIESTLSSISLKHGLELADMQSLFKQSAHWGSVDSFVDMAEGLSELRAPVLTVPDLPHSLGMNMLYMAKKKGNFPSVSLDFSTTPQKGGEQLLVIDKPVLKKLQTDVEFRRQILTTKNIKLVVPKSWTTGITPFNHHRLDEILEVKAKEFSESKADPSQAYDVESMPILLKTLGFSADRIHVLENPKVSEHSSDGKLEDLVAERSFSPGDLSSSVEDVSEKMRPRVSLILKATTQLFGGGRLAAEQGEMRQELLGRAKLNKVKKSNIYYYVPQKAKSYGMVAMIHEQAAGKDIKIISDLSQINYDKKTMIVLLDDVVGSGNSVVNDYGNVVRNLDEIQKGYEQKEKEGLSKKYTPPLVYSMPVIAMRKGKQTVESSCKNRRGICDFVFNPKNTVDNSIEYFDPRKQSRVKEALGDLGHNGNGASTAFFYMSPDNCSSMFARLVASKFTTGGGGVKQVGGYRYSRDRKTRTGSKIAMNIPSSQQGKPKRSTKKSVGSTVMGPSGSASPEGPVPPSTPRSGPTSRRPPTSASI